MKIRTLALFSLLSPLALAHHGIANFDLNKDVALTGTITEIAFVNPHSWLYFDVTGADGSVANWKCELRGSTVLRRSGWTKDMFQPGSQVAITGAPDRFDANTCYMGTIQFANGTSMNRYGQLVEAPPPAEREHVDRLANGRPNFGGDWAAEQRVMSDPRGISGALVPLSTAATVEPGSGRGFPGARGTPESLAADPIAAAWSRPSAVPLTAAGQAAIAAFDPASSDNPRLRCEPTNIIFDWTFETIVNRITQSDTALKMDYGFMNIARTIHLGQTEFPAAIEPSVAGYSIGHWEGDVLVVETKGFLPGILSADAYTPHSADLQVRETFTLDTVNNTLVRDYVAVDPRYFEGEFRGRDVMQVADLPYEPYVCDDRSYHREQ
jgi:hypothetical protein